MDNKKLGEHGKLRTFDKNSGKYLPENTNKMSSKELSELLKIDLSNKNDENSIKIQQGKDNILPELNANALTKMGIKENKKVLLKSSIIERNIVKHPDITVDTIGKIIQNALYNYDEIIPGKNKNQKYFSFIKIMRVSSKNGQPIYGAVLLDVNVNNDNFEIVHCHWVKEKNLQSLK